MIHKLKFQNKEDALLRLMDKGVIQDKQYTDENDKLVVSESPCINGTEAVVYIGKIVNKPAEYDAEGNVIKKATYKKGFNVDVMTNDSLDFGDAEVTGIKNAVHNYS